MANKDPSRTERATPKRRNKARSEGNVPKSMEVTKAVTTLCGMAAIVLYSGVMADHLEQLFRYFMTESFTLVINARTLHDLLTFLAKELAILLLPILLCVAFGAFLSLRMQIGKLWTTKVFKFRWDRFNIINALKRMFASPETFVRLFRSLLQAVIIGSIPFMLIRREFENFLPLYYANAQGVVVYMLTTGFKIVLYTLIPMGVIAAADLFYTRWNYEENLKMTKNEVKDEARQAEGDPKIKQQQRQKMMQMTARRMMKDVPRADVVITNPTHIAVALRYNSLEAPAPVVLAMGADRMAERIKEVAREHNIPIRENVPLARALYKSVRVGDMIPEELYKAVASVLASVWRARGKKPADRAVRP